MGYIYKITNNVNDKVYIGQTSKTIEERFKKHLSLAKRKVNRYLYDAMNYYGFENFSVELVEECECSQLDQKEKYWIAYYKSNDKKHGYNMTEGGGGGDTWANNPHKQETILKIKQTKIKRGTYGKAVPKGTPSGNKGKYLVLLEQDKNNLLNDLNNGLTNTELSKKYQCSKGTLISRCKVWFGKTPDEIRGIRLSEEEKEKKKEQQKQQSKENRSKKWTGEKNPNYKMIDFNLLEEMLKENKTLQEISQNFNVSKPTIIKKIKNKYNMNTKELRKYVKSKN